MYVWYCEIQPMPICFCRFLHQAMFGLHRDHIFLLRQCSNYRQLISCCQLNMCVSYSYIIGMYPTTVCTQVKLYKQNHIIWFDFAPFTRLRYAIVYSCRDISQLDLYCKIGSFSLVQQELGLPKKKKKAIRHQNSMTFFASLFDCVQFVTKCIRHGTCTHLVSLLLYQA